MLSETKRFLIDVAAESNLAAHQNFGTRKAICIPKSESISSTYGKLLVTENLGRALPYLRLRDQPRVLWIDAICPYVDQHEAENHQNLRFGPLFSEGFRFAPN